MVIEMCMKYPGPRGSIFRFASETETVRRFDSETAVRRFQKRNGHLDPVIVFGLKYPLGLLESFLDIIVFQGEDDGRSYRKMCKRPRGSTSN